MKTKKAQIERKNNRLPSPTQTVRQSGGAHQLGDSGAIFFDSLYDDIREKSFDEAACLFEALLDLIKHHPGMDEERAALTLIVNGDEALQKCQAVKRSQALNN